MKFKHALSIIPKLANDPQYRTMADNLATLQRDRTAKVAELEEARRLEYESRHGFDSDSDRTFTPTHRDHLRESASAAVLTLEPLSPPAPPPADIAALAREVARLDLAIDMQQVEMQKRQAAWSKEVCAPRGQLRAAYAERVAAACAKAQELFAASEAEREFREAMDAAGITFASWLPAMPASGMVGQGDQAAAIFYQRQAKEHGYI